MLRAWPSYRRTTPFARSRRGIGHSATCSPACRTSNSSNRVDIGVVRCVEQRLLGNERSAVDQPADHGDVARSSSRGPSDPVQDLAVTDLVLDRGGQDSLRRRVPAVPPGAPSGSEGSTGALGGAHRPGVSGEAVGYGEEGGEEGECPRSFSRKVRRISREGTPPPLSPPTRLPLSGFPSRLTVKSQSREDFDSSELCTCPEPCTWRDISPEPLTCPEPRT
jgi:hypothetical protein